MNFDPPKLMLALSEILGDRVRERESLSRRSSLRIGGEADYWVEPHTLEELEQVAQLVESADVPMHLVGLGSNTLFPDEGLRGVTVRLSGEFAAWESLGQDRVEVGAGCVNAHLVRGLLGEGLTGAEFLVLIPGTFGGAVVMNAGTKEAEVSSILESVRLLVCDLQRGWHTVSMTPAELDMRYRHATLPERAIVTSGTLALSRGDVERARGAASEDKARRNRTQPYKLASAGSTFANPPGDYAGRLIEAVGLKGERVGGARISELHANFFINEDGASARDFLTLMATARAKVRARFGVDLHPEVRFVGFDGFAELARLEAGMREVSNA